MRRVTFDLDVLRSFATGIELGSFARAADRLGRSTSAISAQLKKLEEQAGTPIFRRAGRGLGLTEAGETMLAYARRLLDLNDEAAVALHGLDLEGWIRLGLQEDFGDSLLPAVLGRFARAHPKVRIEARVARNAELMERLAGGRLDLALVWGEAEGGPHGRRLAEVPMRWIGAASQPTVRDDAIPLIAFESPCLFRETATAALDRAGIPWRLAFTSPNLSGLWAATAAGLGVTIRTGLGLPGTLAVIDEALPGPLPRIALTLHQAEAEPSPPARRLADLIGQAVSEMVP